jgi:hypothetical protein
MLLREGRKIEFHNVKTIQRNCCGNNIEIVWVTTSKLFWLEHRKN